MHQLKFSGLGRSLLLAISLLIVPLAVPVFALQGSSPATSTQNSASTQGGSSSQTTTTTSKSTTPTETTRTTTTTAVDPLWIGIGAVALLALLAIVFLAMRGRGRDQVTTAVSERETVIKK